MTASLTPVTIGRDAPASQVATREHIGNKAHGLVRMAAAGLPIPPAFVLGTDACRAFFELGGRLPEAVEHSLDEGIAYLERATGLAFGGGRKPLLVAVRSGAAASMPGMLQTILNVGLTTESRSGLIRATGDPRFVWDTFRRLVQEFAEVVRGASPDAYERRMLDALTDAAVPSESELDVAALKALSSGHMQLYEAHAGEPFPDHARTQLRAAVTAVFQSWQEPTARAFRQLHGLDESAGTAVTVQAMVFGNMGSRSGSGVGFTRDPATGDNQLYVDFLFNAQGEDVVSGRRTAHGSEELARRLPHVHAELETLRARLEHLFGDVQDFEFTVERGQLFLLQTRAASRTTLAALRITVEMADAGLIDRATALERLAGLDLEEVEQRRLAAPAGMAPLARGTGASPGVAVGPIALDAGSAQTMAASGRAPILVRPDAATSDLGGMAAAAGVLTAQGSRTSHAAVVARQLDRVCIVGCRELAVDIERRRCHIAGRLFHEGDLLSLDGGSGVIYEGDVPIVRERPERHLEVVGRWRAEASGEQPFGREADRASPGQRSATVV
jgi:pyruvate,orthophosphate dikinase